MYSGTLLETVSVIKAVDTRLQVVYSGSLWEVQAVLYIPGSVQWYPLGGCAVHIR